MSGSYCMNLLFRLVKIFDGEVSGTPEAVRRKPMLAAPIIAFERRMTAVKRARAAICLGVRGLLVWLLYAE